MHELIDLLARTQFQNSLASGLILLVLGLLVKAFDPRPKVLWGVSHEFHFALPARPGAEGQPPAPPVTVRTQTIFVHNVGRAPAKEVEVFLGMEPQHYQLWPLVNYGSTRTPENFYVVQVPNLGHKEHFTMEVLQVNADLPFVQRVRTDQGEAARVPLLPQRVFSGWVHAVSWVLLLLGAWTALRLALDFLRSTGGH